MAWWGCFISRLKTKRKTNNDKAPRICMLTSRSILHNAFRCGFFDAEDVLCEIDNVELLELKPKKGCRTRQLIQKSLISKDFTKKIVSFNMAYSPIRLANDYDLFIVYLPVWTDLIQIPAIRHWKNHCKVSICWIDEFWASGVPKLKSYLSALQDFDHIVLGLEGTVNVMRDATNLPCSWLPHGVNSLHFNPYPSSPPRVIDIYSIGRMWNGVHKAFLNYTSKNELFYIYDTFHVAETRILNYRAHREMIANLIKRCRYFPVSPAKMDVMHQSKGQAEVGARYYEGSAAGAVMIGQIPDSDSFRKLFGWKDSVIEIKQDGSDVFDILAQLDSEPQRVNEIRRRNVYESILRHDWVYRWERILDIAGLNPEPELSMRKDKLKRLAEQIRNID
jgi:hypothetical protein